MLADGKVIQELKQQDKGLWNRVKKYVEDLCRKIREVYKKLKPDSFEGQTVAKMRDAAEEMRRLFTEGLQDAAENYQGNSSSEISSSQVEKRYSFRDVDIDRNYINYGDREAEKKATGKTVDDLESRGKFITVTDEQVAKHGNVDRAGDYKAARAYLKSMLKGFMGDSVYFEYNGNRAEVYLTKDGVNHSVGGTITSDKAAIFEQFKTLVKNAVYAFSTKNDVHSNANKAIKGRIDWDCFVALAKIGNVKYPVIFKIRTIDSDVRSQIYEMATKKEADGSHDHGQREKPLDELPDYGVVPSTSKNSIRNSGQDVKQKNSLRDSDGRQLSESQQKYFRNSVVRDENGSLLVMYHGTPNGGFTKFRSGSYFTQNPEYAAVYQKPGASMLSHKKTANNPQSYQVYLNMEKPFDTRNPKERDIFMKEYYRKYGTGAPLSESGLPDWTDGMDLQEFIEDNEYDYDGLILDEGAIGGYGEEVKSRGLSYVVFSSEQVKNVSNKNPTSDPDIRYSLRDTDVQKVNAALEKQNEKLREDVTSLKELLKLQKSVTGGKLYKDSSLTTAAKYLMENTGAKGDVNEFKGLLRGVYDYIAGGTLAIGGGDGFKSLGNSVKIVGTLME